MSEHGSEQSLAICCIGAEEKKNKRCTDCRRGKRGGDRQLGERKRRRIKFALTARRARRERPPSGFLSRGRSNLSSIFIFSRPSVTFTRITIVSLPVFVCETNQSSAIRNASSKRVYVQFFSSTFNEKCFLVPKNAVYYPSSLLFRQNLETQSSIASASRLNFPTFFSLDRSFYILTDLTSGVLPVPVSLFLRLLPFLLHFTPQDVRACSDCEMLEGKERFSASICFSHA